MLNVDLVSVEKIKKKAYGGFRKNCSYGRKNYHRAVTDKENNPTSMEVYWSSENYIVVLFDTRFNSWIQKLRSLLNSTCTYHLITQWGEVWTWETLYSEKGIREIPDFFLDVPVCKHEHQSVENSFLFPYYTFYREICVQYQLIISSYVYFALLYQISIGRRRIYIAKYINYTLTLIH